VRKFKPVTRPCMEPVEWAIADSDAFTPIAADYETTIPPKTRSPSPGPRTEIDLGAVRRPRQPQNMRFIVKGGVRHVYISSLDELRHRLNLDEKREAGVSPEDLPKGNGEQEPDRREGGAAGRQQKRAKDKRAPILPEESEEGIEVEIEIDQEKLARSAYSGPPQRSQDPPARRTHPQDQAGDRAVGPAILQRQEVREVFGADIKALNDVIFQQADRALVEPAALNTDVELLIGSLSERLLEESSKDLLRQFADVARDPLGEERAQLETDGTVD